MESTTTVATRKIHTLRFCSILKDLTTKLQVPARIAQAIFSVTSLSFNETNNDVIEIIQNHMYERIVDIIPVVSVAEFKLLHAQLKSVRSDSICFVGAASLQSNSFGFKQLSIFAEHSHIYNSIEDYFWENYGFKLDFLLEHNPKQLEINLMSNVIRSNFQLISLMIDGKSNAVFVESFDTHKKSINLYHSEGLLSLPMFQHLGIVRQLILTYKMLHLSNSCKPICGYSLGEFVSICTMFSTIDGLLGFLNIIFKRACIQQYLNDNAKGFKRVFCNLQKMSVWFENEDKFASFIQKIREETNQIIEISHFNVKNKKLYVTGESKCIAILQNILHGLVNQQLELNQINETVKLLSQKLTVDAKESPVCVLNSKQFPTHTSFFHTTVEYTKTEILSLLNQYPLDPDLLKKQYVPCIIGEKFDTSNKFITRVFEITHDPMLHKLKLDIESKRTDKTYVSNFLVACCLSYLSSKPVLWHQCMQTIFNIGCRNVLEISMIQIEYLSKLALQNGDAQGNSDVQAFSYSIC